MPARLANVSTHSIAALPAAGTLTNSGAKTAGGMENVGTATSSTFTMSETMTCIETVNSPITSPPVTIVSDGLETAAGPMISITDISRPAS